MKSISEIVSFQEAKGNEYWQQDMKIEYDALMKNKTWDLVLHPKGINFICYKWVHKTKINSDGNIEIQIHISS